MCINIGYLFCWLTTILHVVICQQFCKAQFQVVTAAHIRSPRCQNGSCECHHPNLGVFWKIKVKARWGFVNFFFFSVPFQDGNKYSTSTVIITQQLFCLWAWREPQWRTNKTLKALYNIRGGEKLDGRKVKRQDFFLFACFALCF